jgi:hypothetical protein
MCVQVGMVGGISGVPKASLEPLLYVWTRAAVPQHPPKLLALTAAAIHQRLDALCCGETLLAIKMDPNNLMQPPTYEPHMLQ